MSEPALSDPVETDRGPAGRQPAPVWLRLAGLAVACAGGLLLALVGGFLTPLRFGSYEVPVSLVLVVGGLVIILRFAHAVTDHVGLALIPGLVWLLVSLVLSVRTTEGDLVLLQGWVATLYLLLGSVTIGVVVYRMILPPRR
jgi:hypothetical protein